MDCLILVSGASSPPLGLGVLGAILLPAHTLITIQTTSLKRIEQTDAQQALLLQLIGERPSYYSLHRYRDGIRTWNKTVGSCGKNMLVLGSLALSHPAALIAARPVAVRAAKLITQNDVLPMVINSRGCYKMKTKIINTPKNIDSHDYLQ